MRNRSRGRKNSGMMTFPAPKSGWIRNENLQSASGTGAEVLDNWFPTSEGARMRKGSSLHANVTDAVKALMPYNDGGAGTLYAATQSDIYDITSPSGTRILEDGTTRILEDGTTRITEDGGGGFPKMANLGAGDWSYVQTSTSAGDYLVAVNGTDYAIYHGTSLEPIADEAVNELTYDALTADFAPGLTLTGGTSGATATIFAIEPLTATTGVLKVGTVSGGPFQDNETITDSSTGSATVDGTIAAGSAITITNVATKDLSFVWSSHQRLFFIEKNSMSAWYLPAASIGGAATELPLGAVFEYGGELLFGATWSLDSGSGQDDVCIFVTTEGEIAVYSGTNPASASTWSLVGVYKVGKPLNKHSSFQAGGDVAIITEDGIIPVSAATKKDRAALQMDAITYPIEDAWQDVVFNRSADYPVSATLWQSATMLIVGTPDPNVAFVSNARTGAWCRFTGWDVRCGAVFGDDFYFGSEDGTISIAETGGSDQGVAYAARWVPKFSEAGNANCKFAMHARLRTRSKQPYTPTIQCFGDYQIDAYEPVLPLTETLGATWGSAVWGESKWGDGGKLTARGDWQSVTGSGVSLAPAFQLSSIGTQAPTVEVIAGELVYETGNPF